MACYYSLVGLLAHQNNLFELIEKEINQFHLCFKLTTGNVRKYDASPQHKDISRPHIVIVAFT